MAEPTPLGPLRQQIVDAYSLQELNVLCSDLGVKYDNLSGDTLDVKAVELLNYMERRNKLARLTDQLQKERPDINWLMPTQLQSQYTLRRNVRATWINGVLNKAVPDEIALELQLTLQPDKLARTVTYVPGQAEQSTFYIERLQPTWLPTAKLRHRYAWLNGIFLGLVGGLQGYGGQTIVRHKVLRCLLTQANILPFGNDDAALVAYLDSMVDRIFLRRVGGGWVFIHRTLLDYFASLHPSQQSQDPTEE